MQKWFGVVLGVVCLIGATACGSSKKSSSATSSTAATSTPAAAASPAVEKLVPAAVKSKATLTVASDASYAPVEFVAPDGHTVIGSDPDLLKALGGVMGLKVNVVNVPFASILAGLAAGKYDVGASAFTDTKAREKTVDFVDYFTAGEAFMTKAQGATSIAGLADLCGKSVAVESATTELMDAQTQSGKCKKAGKPAVKLLVFPDQNSANLALGSGRAEIDFADTPVIDYQIKKSNGLFKLTGTRFGFAPYGLAIPKQPGLAPAVLAALKVIQANGAYSAVFAKWGLQSGDLPVSGMKINGATS